MGNGFSKMVAFSLMLVFLLPMLNHNAINNPFEQFSAEKEVSGSDVNYPELANVTYSKDGFSVNSNICGYTLCASSKATSDGGAIIMTSIFVNDSSSDSDIWIIKTDSDGVEEWNNTFGGPFYDLGYDIIQNSEGGYTITGRYSYSSYNDMWIINVDTTGNEIWNKTFGAEYSDHGQSIIESGDGGFISIGGSFLDYEDGGDEVLVVKVDSAGALVWEKTFGSANTADYPGTIAMTSDGGFVIAGSTHSFGSSSESHGWLIKIDSTGNEVWNKTHSQPKHHISSLVETADGGFVGIGSSWGSDISMWMFKTESNGDFVWSNYFGDNSFGDSIAIDTQGDFFFTGRTTLNDNTDLTIIKTNKSGIQEWNLTKGGAGDDHPVDIIEVCDSTFSLVGVTSSFGTEVSSPWFLKSRIPDTDFSSVCNERGDAWLNLELISWQGNSSTTWDNDGTDMDVQFQVCIDLDGDSDGISPLCTWTEVWNDTLTLSNAWETNFDLIEDNTTLNITIECWDNDEFADEWNNGPDACDMNPNNDEWRLYYEANWSNITTDTFGGDGSIGNDTQWGNAESTWKVMITYYGDSDSDGISDNIDSCSNTNNGDLVDDIGCSSNQYDWDSDGIMNIDDECLLLAEESCFASDSYIFDRYYGPSGNQRYQPVQAYHTQLAVSPDGRYLAAIVQDTDQYSDTRYKSLVVIDLDSGDEHFFGSHLDLELQAIVFSPNGEHLVHTSGNKVWVYTTRPMNLISEFSIETECRENGAPPWGTSKGASFTYNSEFFKLNCGYDGDSAVEFVYSMPSVIKVESFMSSDKNGTHFQPYSTTNPPYLDLEKTEVFSIHQTGFDGFEIRRNNEVISVDVGAQVNKISATGDGNSLLISSDIGAQIFNLSTGQSFEVKHEGNSIAPANLALISSNGLRIITESGHGWNVFERDRDYDGFPDSDDVCPTIYGEFSGCLEEFFDTDEDGVNDKEDQCPGTTEGTNVDDTGCAMNQLDSDGDGISDATDQCPNTPSGDSVGLTGCASSQVDTDGDGVYDSQDNCPSTPTGTTVDSTGCAPDDVVDLDSDGDGVRDSVDACPNSATGVIVDSTGCETNGDVQEVEDEVSTDDSSDALYGVIGLLVVFGIIAAAVAGIKSLSSSSDDGYDWDYDSYSSVSNQTISTPQPEPNLELQNIVAELERQRMQSEREMNQLRQQQAQQSSASEIAAMQREMQALQQRVADSEQAKLQLQNEIEQVKIQKDESINMQDSVVGGDMVASGATKIDRQTNESHSTVGIQDSAFTGDAITSGGQKIESQTNISGIDSDLLEKLLDRERQAAEETARMKEELARLRKEQNE
tara:strand:+ start:738 stop:4721 length:3984 start_codon:yes stop_codon:yes gene_type:complete